MDKIVAKKKFGQNFLKDEHVLRQIIEAMPNTSNSLVEIGPGLGDLTKYLVDVRGLTAFEVDTDLCKHLNERFKTLIKEDKLQLHCGDVLKSWDDNLVDEDYDLVANLPYYIATNIILRALADEKCKNLLVMVQLEVAKKFAANAGEKNFGALGIITQSVGTASIVIDVPPTAFDPAPKVDSAVLLIQKSKSRSDREFEQMLSYAFTQPRKTLLKNLSSHFDKALITKALEEMELPLTYRPHQLTTEGFHQLYKKIT
ncbi:MAG: 16S rRNA (adenine(1518)-N(6)/adenine(1519)-N(6))-dimethyltransferase RsmA [Helicobacteraceae bacterium]|nr:16S rRNA (adenine(1518)-N(6)/adenine(1519)-N(6))-dimethyltransferase RsmA [Helicobacteraceae bacterium]